MNLWNHVDEAPEGNENEFVCVKNWRWGRKKKNFTRVRETRSNLERIEEPSGGELGCKNCKFIQFIKPKDKHEWTEATCVVPNSHHDSHIHTCDLIFNQEKEKVPQFFHCSKYLMWGWVIVLVDMKRIEMEPYGETQSLEDVFASRKYRECHRSETTIGIKRELQILRLHHRLCLLSFSDCH